MLQVVFQLQFQNAAAVAIEGVMMQFNKNSFGLLPPAGALPVPSLPPGGSASVQLPISVNVGNATPPPASDVLQVAIKSNLGVSYFQDKIRLEVS